MGLLTIKPEINIAKLLIKRHNIEPGFSIEDILNLYADVSFESIPNAIDGISLYLKSSTRRPFVIISDQFPKVRQRFTMAHELGHILIPWHLGVIISHTEGSKPDYDNFYDECEAEANRFAAELLMPSDWIRELIRLESPVEAFKTVVETAKVSGLAAFYALCKHLPDDYIAVIADAKGNVVKSASSESRVQLPLEGEKLKSHLSFTTADSTEEYAIKGGHIVYFIRHIFRCAPTISSGGTWRDILYRILEDIGEDRSVVTKICGCLAYINNQAKNRDEFFKKGKQRISSDSRFSEIYNHKDFDQFLAMRIDEFISNRKSKI